MLRVFDDLPNYKKDDLSEKLIEKALGKSMHLQHIVANPGALKDIVRAMQSKKFPDKYIVIKAGEQGT